MPLKKLIIVFCLFSNFLFSQENPFWRLGPNHDVLLPTFSGQSPLLSPRLSFTGIELDCNVLLLANDYFHSMLVMEAVIAPILWDDKMKMKNTPYLLHFPTTFQLGTGMGNVILEAGVGYDFQYLRMPIYQMNNDKLELSSIAEGWKIFPMAIACLSIGRVSFDFYYRFPRSTDKIFKTSSVTKGFGFAMKFLLPQKQKDRCNGLGCPR